MSCHLLGFQPICNFKVTEKFEGKSRITFHTDSNNVESYITIQQRLADELRITTNFTIEEIWNYQISRKNMT